MAKPSHKIRLHAAPDHAYQALATRAGLQSWFTPHVEGQASAGHEVKMPFSGKEPFRWRMSAFKPATHVHWECLEGPGSAKGTSVTYTLNGQGGQTVLECGHDGWLEGHEAFATCDTLWGILMGRLRGAPRPARRTRPSPEWRTGTLRLTGRRRPALHQPCDAAPAF